MVNRKKKKVSKNNYSKETKKAFFELDKKGISVIISYVLLIVFAIVISAIVFQWLRSYIPARALECPSGVSIFLKPTLNTTTEILKLEITNTGLFGIEGYFVHIKNNPDQIEPDTSINEELLTEVGGALNTGSYISFSNSENSFKPGQSGTGGSGTVTHIFNLSEFEMGEISEIRIIPIRKQEYKDKGFVVACGEAIVKRPISKVS
ncbi:hypothetical protein K0A97_03385 [Patescibacteria group bacterium]|nr:hypothetical protein [Patescibacteria group bacterium]